MGLIDHVTRIFVLMHQEFHQALFLIAILWVIQLINALLGYRLNFLGIHPRHLRGLIGIPCSPFLHAGFNHLFFNSIPLLILLDFMLLRGNHAFICATTWIMLISGSVTWLFGRRGLHVGASSLAMGYWGYLLIQAYHHPSVLSILLGIICLYYLGGLISGFFPTEERVSWEGHFFGFLAGIAAVYLC